MMNKHKEIPVMVTILFAFWSSPGWTEGGVGGLITVTKSTDVCQSCTVNSILGCILHYKIKITN